jgi:RNA polymerase sigma factor (sigma-70 family)
MLLDRFLSGDERDAEEAFRELMFRHGPMVLAVCRQALNGSHDAEDAFQATFLTLARKASTIRDRQYLAGWLCEVAHRIAVRSRGTEARRRTREAQLLAISDAVDAPEEVNHADRAEVRPLIQEEIHRLPEKYRAPVLLRYFEDRSYEEVAELLGWPVGTVKGRLSRARDLLRERLKRRGVALSAAFLLFALKTEPAPATTIETELMEEALQAGLRARRPPAAVAKAEATPSARMGTARRALFILALLTIAAWAFERADRGRFNPADLYQWVVNLVIPPFSPAAHCH